MTSMLKLASKIAMSDLLAEKTEDLTFKADCDLANVTQEGIANVFNWLIPDFSAEGTTITNNSSIPYDGWVRFHAQSWGSGGKDVIIEQKINNILVNRTNTNIGGAGDNSLVFLPVKKGDIYSVSASGGSSTCVLYKFRSDK